MPLILIISNIEKILMLKTVSIAAILVIFKGISFVSPAKCTYSFTTALLDFSKSVSDWAMLSRSVAKLQCQRICWSLFWHSAKTPSKASRFSLARISLREPASSFAQTAPIPDDAPVISVYSIISF